MKNLVELARTRRVETPAARMHTYAGPTSEVPTDVAVWRTEMEAGAAGPLHTINTDHVVVVLRGSLTVEVAGERSTADAGDCVVLPADAPRRIVAGADGVTTLSAALPGSAARVADGDPVPVPWAN